MTLKERAIKGFTTPQKSIWDKDLPLETTPHYFKKEQTVFGETPNSQFAHTHLNYDYSDRIREWNYDKAAKSVEAANESDAIPKSCRWYEVYLSAYFNRSIKIEHIIAGVNQSTGYPYQVFGYTKDTE